MTDIRFTIRMKKEIKDRQTELAKKNGYSGLATLIKELLLVYERDPSIVDPTITSAISPATDEKINKTLEEVEDLKRSKTAEDRRWESLFNMLQDLIEYSLNRSGVSEAEIEKMKKDSDMKRYIKRANGIKEVLDL